MRAARIAVALIILTALVASLMLWPRLPARMATHWGVDGEPDGTMGRTWGALLLPFLLAFVAALLFALPRLDPLGGIAKFLPTYEWFVAAMSLFLALVHAQVLAWNLGWELSFNSTMPLGLGVLFVAVGLLCLRSERNWFAGIRTPWTLSSDEVWRKTNQLGGWLFVASGALAALGALFPRQAFLFLIGPVLAAVVVTVPYSYVVYRRLQKSA